MAINKERMGEIALLVLKRRIRQEGLRLKPNMQREIANEAQAMGLTPQELTEFAKTMATELFAEAFPTTH